MSSITKGLSLLFVVILAISSLITVESASAQSIPKPSVPEFIVRYVDHSYDEPAIYDVDPYTGKTVVTQGGYHVQNNSVELIIKNQPYHSYRNENGSLVWLYYNIAIKGHFEQWTTEDWASDTINMKIYESYPTWYIPSSESGNTVIAYGIAGDNGTETAYKYRTPTYGTPFYYGYFNHALENISIGGQVDFRIQAIIGYSTRINTTYSGPPIGLEPGESYHYYIFTGQTSDWSNTQTISIPADIPLNSSPTPTTSPTQNPTSTTSQSDTPTGFDWQTIAIVVLVVVVAVLVVGMVALWRRTSSKQEYVAG
jgi:hypothetical protein